MFSLSSIVFLAIGFAAIIYALVWAGRRSGDLPPGPPTLPIIGNLHQIPVKRTHLKLTQWAQECGGIYSLKLGSTTAIVLTDRRLVKEMLDRKSSVYSGRPISYVGHTLITDGDHILTMHYGNLWRSYRKLVHQFFNEGLVEKNYVSLVSAEAIQLLRDLCVSPYDHMLHSKRFSNSVIMSLIYGVRTPNIKTSHMTKLYALMYDWSQVMEPGNTPPVDVFPFLRWVPERFLGSWISRAKSVHKEMNTLYFEYMDLVVQRRVIEGNKQSFMDQVLDQRETFGFNEHQIAFLCGTVMEGGSDTSSSMIIAFMKAMAKWPEVQKRAQLEIDAIVGEKRSASWADYTRLPYVAGIVKETMRWRPVVPLAFPHVLAEDDVVDGYHIPKDSTVFLNVYGLNHDPSRFPDPDVFNPSRFEGCTTLASHLATAADPNDRDHYSYGASRRICPGMHLAERNLFIGMVKMLWAFEIKPAKDNEGRDIEIDVSSESGYSAGFLVGANDFACEVVPRSEKRRETIMREFAEAEKSVFGRYQCP
ncbi:putative cytochrome P450 [Mytilinidion resinicola]|uniref:Cytochrome P450 n=1 Tax=Mytilinidion resinicola TaxID=574789 RepID=A0A6A6YVJ0_9PEZI|nr:putative cytochrome P450 [Mytilinidion resinicola]KAF2811937.1 putative cytochrome P450 [Mytilinidion resinicola]